jgi:hypothetical protein
MPSGEGDRQAMSKNAARGNMMSWQLCAFFNAGLSTHVYRDTAQIFENGASVSQNGLESR